MRELKEFYVTFGAGTFFGDYHQEIRAFDLDIVFAYMNKHYKDVWSDIKTKEPEHSKPLKAATELFYSDASHV